MTKQEKMIYLVYREEPDGDPIFECAFSNEESAQKYVDEHSDSSLLFIEATPLKD